MKRFWSFLVVLLTVCNFSFAQQKTAYEIPYGDWSSDVCSSDLKGAKIYNSTIGPYVSVGGQTHIDNCEIKDTIIQCQSKISNAKIQNSMIGNHVIYDGDFTSLSLGDYSALE